MALHGVGDIQQALGGELAAPQHVGAHGTGHQQRGRGTQTPADGDVGVDVDFYAPDFLTEGGQHGAVGYVGKIVGTGEGFVAAGDLQTAVRFFEGDVGIQAQGHAEGVEAGAEVRCGGRHTDGYSFHNVSPE